MFIIPSSLFLSDIFLAFYFSCVYRIAPQGGKRGQQWVIDFDKGHLALSGRADIMGWVR